MCLITVFSFFAFSQSNETIIWSKNRKLTKQDFRQNKSLSDIDSAKTFCEIRTIQTALYPDSIYIEVVCLFNSELSLINPQSSNEVLKHQQGYFDIAEIIAREIRKTYSEHISTDISYTSEYLEIIFGELFYEEKNKIEQQYALETNYGQNVEAQKQWDKKIERLLAEYRDYDKLRVVIKRKAIDTKIIDN